MTNQSHLSRPLAILSSPADRSADRCCPRRAPGLKRKHFPGRLRSAGARKELLSLPCDRNSQYSEDARSGIKVRDSRAGRFCRGIQQVTTRRVLSRIEPAVSSFWFFRFHSATILCRDFQHFPLTSSLSTNNAGKNKNGMTSGTAGWPSRIQMNARMASKRAGGSTQTRTAETPKSLKQPATQTETGSFHDQSHRASALSEMLARVEGVARWGLNE
jgi:hypothetical protein